MPFKTIYYFSSSNNNNNNNNENPGNKQDEKVILASLYNFLLSISYHGSDVIINNNKIFTC